MHHSPFKMRLSVQIGCRYKSKLVLLINGKEQPVARDNLILFDLDDHTHPDVF